MGMLWDGRWETLPLREYFCLPYDRNHGPMETLHGAVWHVIDGASYTEVV